MVASLQSEEDADAVYELCASAIKKLKGKRPTTPQESHAEQLLLELTSPERAVRMRSFSRDGISESFEFAIHRLVDIRSPECAKRLRGMLDSGRANQVKFAAEHLAQFADPKDLPRLLQLLSDSPPSVADRVGFGLTLAVGSKGGVPPGFKLRVGECAHKVLVASRKSSVRPESALKHRVAGLLLLLDREKAIKTFASRELLSPANVASYVAIFQLVFAAEEEPKRVASRLDASLLWPLLERARRLHPKKLAGAHRNSWETDVLSLTSLVDPARSVTEIKALLKRPASERYDKHSLRESLRRSSGLPNVEALIALAHKPKSRLPTAVRGALIAVELFDELNNDGLALYFLNRRDQWRTACDGLRALKLPQAVGVLKDAANELGVPHVGSPAKAWSKWFDATASSAEEAAMAAERKLSRYAERSRSALDQLLLQHAEFLRSLA